MKKKWMASTALACSCMLLISGCSGNKADDFDAVAYTCGGGCSSIQVGCAAHDCTYNRQEVCQADHVHIDGSQACICEETCCGTFRCE